MEVYSSLVKPYTTRPKKRLGQHFLRDTGVIDRIIRWIDPQSGDIFLEIGAGDGALSSRIAPAVARLVAIELDGDCIPRLENALEPYESAASINADILHLDLMQFVPKKLDPQQRLRITGNLPYNIATAIIEKILHCSLPVNDMIFMVQTEVAQRITASPGSRRYGYLSVHCQHHSDVSLGFRVSPSCFVPRPKVSSSMVSLNPKQVFKDPDFESDFESLTKAAFSHRRKTLANSLGKNPLFGSVSNSILQFSGIDGSRRAEDLSVEEFETLTRVYKEKFKPDRTGTS
ncbi:MAG: 16S rRNA (adenine(1518)-N(6)/adenine(1519)-N(6))-dimethyltransferase RsmA [Acidobacteriota bacterium]|jgi:16S rRNA (adenine1518-N6/adenine1519-N6)-dimethyltransferase